MTWWISIFSPISELEPELEMPTRKEEAFTQMAKKKKIVIWFEWLEKQGNVDAISHASPPFGKIGYACITQVYFVYAMTS